MSVSSEFERKLQAAFAELQATGMRRANYDPHFDRGLRMLDLEVRPPHYLPMTRAILRAGGYFAVFWGGFMWLTVWRTVWSPLLAIVFSIFAGALFGLVIAARYRRERRKHQLSDWDAL